MTFPPFTPQAASEASALLALLLRPGVGAQPDPILAAVQRHCAAYDAYQVAPEGNPSLVANDEYDAATEALVSTPCGTRFGALALLAHLRWWIAEEAEFAHGHQPGYRLAQARAGDLTLFLGERLAWAPARQRASVDTLATSASPPAPRTMLGRAPSA